MLWLLAAELRKLVRPLVWGTALAIVAFCLLLTWGAANNAAGGLASPRIPDVCDHAATAQCRLVVAHAHATARAAAAATAQLAQPGEVGHVAAGMLASLPGLLLIAMVAGGHWGGEWGSRTIRQLLCREGRRGRVLAAKWLSIWIAGVLTLLACSRVLAGGRPRHRGRGGPARRPRRTVGRPGLVPVRGRAGRLVLGLFAAIGTAAGTVGRGQLATTALTAGLICWRCWSPGSLASAACRPPRSSRPGWPSARRATCRPTSGAGSPARVPRLGELAGLAGHPGHDRRRGGIARWRFAADVTV